MKDERWLQAAISDDTLVAELLLRLKDSIAGDPTSSSAAVSKPLPPSWAVRQPRSSAPKKKETPRRSPTTPLYFGCFSAGTGGASPSEGYEDSSGNQNHLHRRHQDITDRFRSKGSAGTDQMAAVMSKKPRRKKTFAELKEEESSLLKERTHLKKQLAAWRLTFREQRSLYENLKRMKSDLAVHSRVKPQPNSTELEDPNSDRSGESEAGSSTVSKQLRTDDFDSSEEPIFVLPDLNMDPVEESALLNYELRISMGGALFNAQ